MSGTEQTYHLTKEDVRKAESRESRYHGGNVPAGSASAGLQSIIDSAEKDKPTIIAERQANLPLPEDPPMAPDFNSADQRTVNVGSGGTSGAATMREPAVGIDPVQGTGRAAVDGLGGLPNDAVAQGSKNKQGLADTTNKDYRYPQQNDPADTSKMP